MMASKPIVKSSDVSNDLVADADCGFSLPPGDAKGMVEKIISLRLMDQKSLLKMGANGREYVLKNYTYKKLAQKFIEALL